MEHENLNTPQNPPLQQTAVGRRLLFYNDSQRQPRLNQRVLVYLGNAKEKHLQDLKYTTAVYIYDDKTGSNYFIMDAGGKLVNFDVIWSEMPKIEEEQLDKVLGILPF